MASLPISQLIELLGLTDDDVFIVNDTSVDPPETKRIKAITLLSAVVASKWHAETTIPSTTDGDDDDFWVHTPTGDLYEKQTDGSWTKIGSLRGPKGLPGDDAAPAEPGSQWYAEARDPIDNEGRDSDFHLNTASGDIFQKGGGVWGTSLLNVKRFEGPAEKVTYTNPAYVGSTTVKEALDTLTTAPDYADIGDYVAHVQNGVLFGFIVPRTYIWLSGGIQLSTVHTSNEPFTLSVEVDGVVVATLEVAYNETTSTATNFPVVFLEGQKVRVIISNAVSGEAYYFLKGIALQEASAVWPGETPDGATLQANDTIGWAPVPQAVAYRLHLATLADFSDADVYVTTTPLYSFAGLTAGTYHWKTEPVFADGTRGAESTARTFTV